MKSRITEALLLLVFSGPLAANTFTVDTLADSVTSVDANPGNGICADASGQCPLRAAIMEANMRPGDDGIEFSVAGNIELDGAAGPLPTITDYVVIDGTTAPGFNNSTLNLEDALPVLLIIGSDLSGSTHDGLRFSGAGADSSEIRSIGIGLFPDNAIEIANGADGLVIQGCNIGSNGGAGILTLNTGFHVIGQIYDGFFSNQFLGLGNLIGNNGESGVVLSASDNNTLFGNYIGMLPDGASAAGNDGDGIFIIGDGNVIGFSDANEHSGNYVAGNNGAGIYVSGENNQLFANRIGVGDGPGSFGNDGDGIVVFGTGNRIGAATSQASNLIADNEIGIRVGSPSTSGNQTIIENNRIGIVTGSIGNTDDGIRIIRGDQAEILGNVIISNGGDGLEIHSDDNIVQGNSIGVSGGLPRGNAGHGIFLSLEAERNIIGGGAPGQGNVVGDNGSAAAPFPAGIELRGFDHSLIGNRVGVTSSDANVGQPAAGVELNGQGFVVTDNVIGFNATGLSIGGANMTVEDNHIGVTPDWRDIGNVNDGVRLAPNQGGLALSFGPNNIVAFNGRIGIYSFTNPFSAVPFTIFGNDVIGNASAGIAAPFSGDDGHYSLLFNKVAFNGNSGVLIFGEGTRTRLSANTMFGNNGIAVDINGDGPEPNDPGDPDFGPNRRMNTPVIHSIIYSPGSLAMGTHSSLEVEFRVDAAATNAAYPLTVQAFWTDREEPMQGRYFLSSVEYAVPQTMQTATFDLPFGFGSEGGGKLAMIATDDVGHSSEMSASLVFGTPELMFRDGFELFFAD